MPASIRALAFIVIAIFAVHILLGRNLSNILGRKFYQKLLITYLFVLFVAAVSTSYWLFLIIVFLYILVSGNKYYYERIGMFVILMLALPNFAKEIPGFGGIRYVIDMTYVRFLILTLLLPLMLTKEHVQRAPFRAIGSDVVVMAYVVLIGILGFRENTLTNGLRQFLLLIVDIYMPYFVFSRYITSLSDFRRVFAVFIFGMSILSIISVLEIIKNWHLYAEFIYRLKTWNSPPLYLVRSGMLRATTVFFTPIALGLAATIAYGAYLYLRTHLRGNSLQKFISLLPFIGSVEVENITYRQRLIDNSLLVIQKFPIFGSPNFIEEPEMQVMIQGQGIVDVVNSYIGVMLASGVVGLILFVTVPATLVLSAYKLTREFVDQSNEFFILGISILATMIAILFTIATVSMVDYIPYLYWVWCGLLGAYILIGRTSHQTKQLGNL